MPRQVTRAERVRELGLAPRRLPRPPGTQRASDTSDEWLLLHVRMMGIKDPYIWRQLLVPYKLTLSKLHDLLLAAFEWKGGHIRSFCVKPVISHALTDERHVSELNPTGFTVPKYNLRYDPVHETYDNKEDMDHSVSFGMAMREDPHYANRPAPRSTLDRTQTIGRFNDLYDPVEHRHALVYTYDGNDDWEHLIMVERVIPTEEILAWGLRNPCVLRGDGHGPAENCGGDYGWENLKTSYEVQGTPLDDEKHAKSRRWYERSCANGDPRGLKGEARLRYFDPDAANEIYVERLKRPRICFDDGDDW